MKHEIINFIYEKSNLTIFIRAKDLVKSMLYTERISCNTTRVSMQQKTHSDLLICHFCIYVSGFHNAVESVCVCKERMAKAQVFTFCNGVNK